MDEAEKWLRENDPDFKKYTVRRKSEYPFHTTWQTFSRQRREIPVSNLRRVRHRIGMDDDEAIAIQKIMS